MLRTLSYMQKNKDRRSFEIFVLTVQRANTFHGLPRKETCNLGNNNKKKILLWRTRSVKMSVVTIDTRRLTDKRRYGIAGAACEVAVTCAKFIFLDRTLILTQVTRSHDYVGYEVPAAVTMKIFSPIF
jgi:hypothetical protein